MPKSEKIQNRLNPFALSEGPEAAWDWEIERELRINARSENRALLTAQAIAEALAEEPEGRVPARRGRGALERGQRRSGLIRIMASLMDSEQGPERGYLVNALMVGAELGGEERRALARIEAIEREPFDDPDGTGCEGEELARLIERARARAQREALDQAARAGQERGSLGRRI